MNFNDAKEHLLGNKAVSESFQKKDLSDLKMHVGLQILELRLIRNLTQKQLAKKIGTEQPGIARAERGSILPSLTFLHKIAVATGTELIPPKFGVVEANEMLYQIHSLPTSSITNLKIPSEKHTGAKIEVVEKSSGGIEFANISTVNMHGSKQLVTN